MAILPEAVFHSLFPPRSRRPPNSMHSRSKVTHSLPLALTFLSLGVLSPALSAPRISEINAVNGGEIQDKDGDLSAWVEFYNPGDEAFDLAGLHVTDDPDEPMKYRLPRLSVPPLGYALLYLSGKDFFSLFNAEVHTSFSFNDDDGYFALYDADGTTLIDALEDIEHRLGMSFGRLEPSDDATALFRTPSPRTANHNPIAGVVGDTRFSVDRGFFTQAFEVEITTETEGARIIYTTDGWPPSEGSLFTGPIRHIYEGPITIDQTTVLRAAAFKEGFAPSNIDTQTYLFVEDVIRQDDMRASITESETYGPMMEDALKAIPSLSLAVEDLDDVTIGADRGSDNNEEFPTSVEWLDPDGGEGFQVDAGVSRFGGYFTNFDKESFRLLFRKRYGAAKLRFPVYRGHENGIPPAEEFNSINLRSGSHDMNQRGAYLSNRFIDDTLLDMGHIAPHGRFVHLYVNGFYWGQFHLRERWDADMVASYFGGEPEDYDAINGNNTGSEFLPGEAFNGTGDFWNEARAIAKEPNPFANSQNHVDMGSYLAFQLTWLSGNSESEFHAAGSRTLGVPFKFYFKDADGYLRPPGNRLANRGPGDIFRELTAADEPDFRMFLADTIHKHYFGDGAFTPERNIARLQKRIDETQLSIIAEAARWNYRTPSAWQSFQDNLINQHFPGLTRDMIRLFEGRGWYPDVTAPIFLRRGGEIEPGFVFRMNAGTLFSPQPGEILFTMDKTDPRAPGGAVAEGALTYDRSGPGVVLEETTTIKARLLDPDGEWSALEEATYHIGKKPEPGDLVISEIHYHPAPPTPDEETAGYVSRGDFEFIELYNRSGSTLNLEDVLFTDGIRFDFADANVSLLSPGEMIILVSHPEAFALRYGSEIGIAGHYEERQLSNGGETLRLTNREGAYLMEITYDDETPWPEEPDGGGRSLTVKDPDAPADFGAPASWRASAADGGTPGRFEAGDPDPNGPDLAVDEDGDGLPLFAEEALGSSDVDPRSGKGHLSVQRSIDGRLTVVLRKAPTADASQFELEVSEDLETWTPSEATLETGNIDPARLRWAAETEESARYLRIRIVNP